ncbi:MAG: hypothetical protein NWR72_15240 [Bacteroidia bacterium]|nr:hypothetical protein [Bacteroidia bacterium]
MIRFLLLFSATMLIYSCNPGGEIILVPDNESPPDLTISEVVKENYVNRVYISLLGRKPESGELSASLSLLNQDNVSVGNRTAMVEAVLADPAYKDRQYNLARIELLNNIDTTDIATFLLIFDLALQDPQYADFIHLIQAEIDRLEALSAAAPRYLAGTISRAELHRRMVNCTFYDEINMGTQNFVLSVFEHFLNRYPTTAEESNAILMVDGFYTVMMGKEGNSKDDFLDILIQSDAYCEGQVLDVYESFLFRKPTSIEMSQGTLRYKQTGSYETLLTDVLITNEFLGL